MYRWPHFFLISLVLERTARKNRAVAFPNPMIKPGRYRTVYSVGRIIIARSGAAIMTSLTTNAHVYVVDDDVGVCRSITKALRASGYAATSYESVEAFFGNFTFAAPTVIVVDMRMPLASGLDLLRRVREARILSPIIFLSGESSTQEAVSALKGGAFDFLFKPVSLPGLLRAISSAAEWDKDRIGFEAQQHIFMAKYLTLTRRESELCACIARGERLRDISQKFGIAEATAKIHKARILAKLAVSSPSELALQLAKFTLDRS